MLWEDISSTTFDPFPYHASPGFAAIVLLRILPRADKSKKLLVQVRVIIKGCG